MLKKAVSLTIIFLLLSIFPLNVFAKEFTPSGIGFSELESFVDDYAKSYIGRTTAGASIVIVKDHKIVLSKGYGYADVDNRTSIDAETTVFEWGSISKLLVWVSVMQQVEQGKIDLQMDIRTYLPEGFLTKLAYDTPITMLNLMNHNAGFEDNIFDLCYPSPESVRSLEEGLKIAEPAQIYEPGKVVAYSNYSTSLAAYIVERVTGQEFYEYINEHIFDKLGMSQSSEHPLLADNPYIIPNKAKAYSYADEGSFTLSSWNYMSLYPCGGANGTAVDLAAFAMALMPESGSHSPLFQKGDTLDQMLSQSFSPNKNMLDIAHGFWEYPGEKRGLTHSGNTIAFSSNFHIVPDENFGVIVLTNQMGETGLCYGLTKALVDRGNPVAMEGIPHGGKELEGTYLTTRRSESSIIKVFPYFSLLTVKEIGQNTIRISIAGQSADYVQTAPYVYQKAGGSMLFNLFPQMYFQVEEGQVQQIYTSINDYQPLSEGQPFFFLVVSAIAGILCTLYFIVMPVVLLIRWIVHITRKNKDRKIPQHRLTWRSLYLLHILGGIMIGNCFTLAIRMLTNSNRGYAEIKPHLIINLALTVLTFAFTAAMVLWRKKLSFTKGQKLLAVLSESLLLVLIILLASWNFY